MVRVWQRIFVEHPKSVDETYWQHLLFAGGFAVRLFLAAFAAVIHAVIPCLFEKTASRMIQQLNAKVTKRD